MPHRIVHAVREVGHDHPFLISVIVILAIVLPGYIRLSHLTGCVNDWANGYQDRSQTVTVAAAERQDALDGLVRSIDTQASPKVFIDLRAYILADNPDKQQLALAKLVSDSSSGNTRFQAALTSYIGASDHYNTVLADHPLEAIGNKLNC